MVDKIDSSLESQKENITFDPALGRSIDTRNKVKNLVRSYYNFYKLGDPKIDFKSMPKEETNIGEDGGINSTIAHTEGYRIYCSSQLRLDGSKFENTIIHELGHTIGENHKKYIEPILLDNNGIYTDTLKSFKRFNVTVGRGDGGGESNIVAFEEGVVEWLAIQYMGSHQKKYSVESPSYFYWGNVIQFLVKEKKGFEVSKVLGFKKSSNIFGLLTYLLDIKISSKNINLVLDPILKWRNSANGTNNAQEVLSYSTNAIKEARNNLVKGSLAK